MLVLSRKKDEAIRIGDIVQVMVVEVQRDKVKLGIEAPPEVPVHREEIYRVIREAKLATTGRESTAQDDA